MSKKFMDKDDKGIHPIQKAQELSLLSLKGNIFILKKKKNLKMAYYIYLKWFSISKYLKLFNMFENDTNGYFRSFFIQNFDKYFLILQN